MFDQRISIYCVCESKEAIPKHPDDAYHIIFEKDSLPKVMTYLTHNPKSVPNVTGKHNVFFMLFRGYDASREEIEDTAFRFFRLYFHRPFNVKINFHLNNQKEEENVRRIERQEKRSKGNSPRGLEAKRT